MNLVDVVILSRSSVSSQGKTQDIADITLFYDFIESLYPHNGIKLDTAFICREHNQLEKQHDFPKQ
jgi:hypothetical protein